MSFPRYESYKDSGVEWLGDVPEHWVACRFSRVILAIKDGTHGTFSRMSEGKVFLSAKNVNSGRIEISDDESLITWDDHNYIVSNGFPQKGDLLLTIVGTIGRSCVYSLDEAIAFQRSVCFIRLKKSCLPQFFYFLIQSKFFQEQLQSKSKSSAQAGVYMGDVSATSIMFPTNYEEQQTIAAFLDRETAKIDALIVEQQRLVELLKEKRQAVISHAVTKGLNPNAPMKDSGIEWLGEVPERWEVKRLRFVAQLNPSKGENAGLDRETEVSFLPMEAVGDDGSLNLERTRPVGEVETGYTYFREGDVTIAKITPCFENGKGAVMRNLVGGIGFGTTELIVARPKPFEAASNYLHWLFISTWFRKYGEASMYGAGGQKRVPDDFVRNFAIAFPSYDEQQTIAAFLDRETVKIDTLTTEAKTAITLLQERRTALISAAVTGKIDVRGLVFPA